MFLNKFFDGDSSNATLRWASITELLRRAKVGVTDILGRQSAWLVIDFLLCGGYVYDYG